MLEEPGRVVVGGGGVYVGDGFGRQAGTARSFRADRCAVLAEVDGTDRPVKRPAAVLSFYPGPYGRYRLNRRVRAALSAGRACTRWRNQMEGWRGWRKGPGRRSDARSTSTKATPGAWGGGRVEGRQVLRDLPAHASNYD
ncbi:hypothetical protein FRC11_012557, partial [Ceratobasidium sp. 423]